LPKHFGVAVVLRKEKNTIREKWTQRGRWREEIIGRWKEEITGIKSYNHESSTAKLDQYRYRYPHLPNFYG